MKKIPYTWKKPVQYLGKWNFDHEVNDRVVDLNGNLFRLIESSGRNKRAAGELSTKKINPPEDGMKLRKIDGEWFWVK